MTDQITVTPTRITGLEPPLASAVDRSGFRADPCSSFRCMALNLREAGDPRRLTCPRCGAATIPGPTRRATS